MSIGKGATWSLDGDVGIARGKAKTSIITNSGTLIKSSGTGTSVVGLAITDTGLIEAASGTLDFTGAVKGKGSMKIDAGATLELDSTGASTLTATFAGAGVLALKKAAKFASTIAGSPPAMRST